MGKGLSPQQKVALEKLVQFNIEQEEDRFASLDRRVQYCESELRKAQQQFDRHDKEQVGVPNILGFCWYKTQAEKDADLEKDLAVIIREEERLQQALNPADLEFHWCTFAYLLHQIEPDLPLRERRFGGISRWDAHLFVTGTPGLESKQSSLRRTLKRLSMRGLVSIPNTGNVKLTALGWETAQEMGMW